MQTTIKVLIVFTVLLTFAWSGADAEPPQKQNSTIVVYYFHRTIRCPSCILLEEITRGAVEFEFEKELKNAKIRITAINIDEKDNEHFVNDYDLQAQSVIISEVKDGKEKRWKTLDQVWPLLEDELQLREYIQKEIKGYLNNS